MLTRVQNELSKERLLQFLQSMHRIHGLNWKFIESTEQDIPASAAGTKASSFVVDVCWSFDQFILEARAILTDDITKHLHDRCCHRLNASNMDTTCKCS